ncbi:MAG: ABC transporter ATP-binding protein, partial [Clostridiales bacterium]|nr:ABC transporter ATP-binding protein [Clostridiales bacterium]
MKKRSSTKPGTFPRLVQYLFHYYPVHLIVVMICIVISSLASVVSTAFLQRLIDECITPGITSGMSSVWSKLLSILTFMGILYAMGVVASFTYTRIMAIVTQGTLKHFREDMFDRMETLPIKYFDTHAHGDIMSTYTNDTDAIRQMIGQSLPQVFQVSLTILSILFLMLYYSLWLTLLVCIFAAIMLLVTRKFGGASSNYMVAQQKSLADEEGFIEEIMDGQKVVKVFCHEEDSKADFLKKNEQLFEDGKAANINGNILGPILNNLGNLLYVLLAVVGALLLWFGVTNVGLSGTATISAGIIVSF